MKDPRIANMDPKSMPFDGKRMFWGGFEVLVELEPGHASVGSGTCRPEGSCTTARRGGRYLRRDDITGRHSRVLVPRPGWMRTRIPTAASSSGGFRGMARRRASYDFRRCSEGCRGELVDWACLAAPGSRSSSCSIQFSRTVYRDTAQAFAQDDKALGLAIGWPRAKGLGHRLGEDLLLVPPRPLGADRAPRRTLRFALRSAGRRGARASAEGLCVFGIPGARPSRRHRPLRSPSPIATPCLVGRRPRMSEPTSHPVSSFIGARFKGDGAALSRGPAPDPER